MIEQLIADYESGMSYDALCKKYHHKFATIKKILRENNIDTAARDRKKYITDKRLSNETISNLISDYRTGFSLNKVASKYDLSVQKVRKILKVNDITIRPVSNRKYYLNENYFDDLTENGAYILGFFAADGWNKKKDNMLEITLSAEDAEILESIREEIELSREIRYFQDNKGFNKASLTFSSAKVKRIFESYGNIPNKTYTLKHLPKLNSSLLAHYIRGYADGDGYIGKGNRKVWSICSVNKVFLEDIVDFLYQNYNIDKVNIYVDNRGNNPLYSFQYVKKDSLIKIYENLYQNDYLKLQRKYNRFNDIYNEIKYHETPLHQ